MENETIKSAALEISQTMEIRGVSIEKLAQATGISERFLVNLINEEYAQLPAEPYVRGYVMRIAEVLQLDGDRLWSSFQTTSVGMRRSGKNDILPQNRFKLKGISKRSVIWASVIVLVMLVGVLRFYYVSRMSGLSILNLSDMQVVTSTPFVVIGKVDPSDSLIINDEDVYPDVEGNFEKAVALQVGQNVIVFRVKRLLQKERVVVREVLYQPVNREGEELESEGDDGDVGLQEGVLLEDF